MGTHPIPRLPAARLGLLGWAMGLAVLVISPASGYELTWEDTDWSQENYTTITLTDPDIHPGLLVLASRLDDWRHLANPTQYQGLYSAEVYHDTLFFAASDYPFEYDGAEVITYDYRTGEFAVAYEPYESGLNIIKQFGDTLYIPGPDSMDPWTEDGSIYVYDGTEWVEKDNVPVAVHVCDVEVCNNILYVTTGHFLNPYHGFGCVWTSTDYGDSYTRVLTVEPTPERPARRFFGLGQFQGRLFAQPDGFAPVAEEIYTTTNGTNWDTIPVPGLPVDKHAMFTEWGDSLLMTIDNRMFIWNGEEFRGFWMPFHGYRWCRGIHGIKGELYGGGDDCILYKWLYNNQWQALSQVAIDPSTEEIETIVTYFGRIYVSTSRVSYLDEARLYVAGVESSGQLLSKVHDFGAEIDSGMVFWEDLRPANTEVCLTIRSGLTIEDLEAAPFLGPDGTPNTCYMESGTPLPDAHQGDRYFQYRVFLLSFNGLDMPFVDWIRVEADSVDYAGVTEGPRGEYAARATLRLQQAPANPVRTQAELVLSLATGAGGVGGARRVDARVIDAQGRLVLRDQITLRPDDPTPWRWDLRDVQGNRVTGGVYQLAFHVADDPSIATARALVVMP